MSHDDWNDEDSWDEDWTDGDDELDDEQPARCPECGRAVHSISDRCPACGYWLSDSDRRQLWSGEAKSTWLRVSAIIVLISFLVSLIAAGAVMF